MTRIPTPSGSDRRAHAHVVRLARSAGLTSAATLTSRVLGLVREQVLAALFGAGTEMDAFIIAFRIPNLVRDLFAEGAMSAAFVPTFTRHLTVEGRDAAWRLGNNVLNALVLVTGAIAALAFVAAHPLVGLYAGHFAQTPGKLELTIRLTRVMLPFLTLVALAAAVMGMLNSLHHFFVPALSPAMFNIAIIACGLAVVPLMPVSGASRITAIAVAALAGGVAQVAIQWPSLRREGFRYRPVLDPRDPGLRHVLVLMGPGTIGLAATQVNIFVNTLLATTQGSGAVSWLTYSYRLVHLPLGLIGVSIGTAVLPAVSRHATVGDVGGVRDTVSRGLALMLMLTVPATVGLLALAPAIVRLLFEHGHFRPSDTAQTAALLRLYAVGLIGYSTVRIVSPTFYALRRSGVPVAVSLVSIGLNVLLSVSLVRVMGFRGLALAASIAALANAAALVWVLRRELRGIGGVRLGASFVRITGAALLMGASLVAVEHGAAAVLPGGGVLPQMLRLASGIGAGLVVLAAAAKLFRLREFDEAVAMLRQRLQPLAGTDVAP
ncbi:MAG: murein biosynthesis integral membrane protein MurJ [Betaproteobacteria bacterium]